MTSIASGSIRRLTTHAVLLSRRGRSAFITSSLLAKGHLVLTTKMSTTARGHLADYPRCGTYRVVG